ncbi:hypothetical protein F0562_030123 [Nyssa sinensis]|uniref:Uncharacterized protein n=1 Tax=Nyssa sinensis TaxID=561372 RepID=A0A5J5AXS1_9ASTE|nr:hypothetical protein F0562_030123 [Nyssa sinensis]
MHSTVAFASPNASSLLEALLQLALLFGNTGSSIGVAVAYVVTDSLKKANEIISETLLVLKSAKKFKLSSILKEGQSIKESFSELGASQEDCEVVCKKLKTDKFQHDAETQQSIGRIESGRRTHNKGLEIYSQSTPEGCVPLT